MSTISYHDMPRIMVRMVIEAELTDEAKAYSADFPMDKGTYLSMVKKAVLDEPVQWFDEMVLADADFEAEVYLLPAKSASA